MVLSTALFTLLHQCKYTFANTRMLYINQQPHPRFYTLMVLSTALFDRPAFKNLVRAGLALLGASSVGMHSCSACMHTCSLGNTAAEQASPPPSLRLALNQSI